MSKISSIKFCLNFHDNSCTGGERWPSLVGEVGQLYPGLAALLSSGLRYSPAHRPSAEQLLSDPFFLQL
jgi:hypothetical protein